MQYRAEFDAVVTFRNGGGLQTQGFRVDVPHPEATEAEIAALFIASLSLLMVDRVVLNGVRVFAEQHKGTHRGPSSALPARAGGRPAAFDRIRSGVVGCAATAVKEVRCESGAVPPLSPGSDPPSCVTAV